MEKVTRHIRLKLGELPEEAARRYFGWMRQRQYSEQTQRAAFLALKTFLSFLAAQGKPLSDMTREDLDAHHIALQDRGLAPSTVFQQMASIRAFCNWLDAEGLVFINPARGLVLPRPSRRVAHVPSEEDVRKLLAAPKTHTRAGIRDRAFMETIYSTGARLVEMTSLSVFDVDLRAGVLKLHYGKSRKQRAVPLGKKALRWLEEYIRLRHHLLNGRLDEEALWLNRFGEPLTYHAAERIVHGHARAAGIRPFSAHALRRACATHMLRRGAHPVQLQMLLGHASLKYLSQYLDVGILDLQKTHRQSKPGR